MKSLTADQSDTEKSMKKNIKTISVRLSSALIKEIVSRKAVTGRSIKGEVEYLIQIGLKTEKMSKIFARANII